MMNKNDGFILPIGLIFLLLLSLLSISSLKSSGLQYKITSNLTDRLLSFERAESALSQVENSELIWNMEKIRQTPGYYNSFNDPHGAPNFLQNDWDQTHPGIPIALPSIVSSDSTEGVVALDLPPPLVILEELYFTETHNGLNPDSQLTNVPFAERYIRITTKAQGLRPSTVTVLQSVIKHRYPRDTASSTQSFEHPLEIARVSWYQIQ
ncbi:MAG: hypothetical protein GKR95_23990 [Gammaproteobacteria bacterium]|nr:hypothetical protein [Gammaproteobacteria bacterium]